MSREIKISNISSCIQGDILFNLFGFLGNIETMILAVGERKDGTLECVIRFESTESIKLAKRISGLELGDNRLIITDMNYQETKDILEHTRTIYVGNVPIDCSEHRLTKFFVRNIGKVTFMKLCESQNIPTRYAWIEFESNNLMHLAISTLNGKDMDGGPLYICPSKDDFCKVQTKQPNSTSNDLSHIVRSDNPLYAGLSSQEIKRKMELLNTKSGSFEHLHESKILVSSSLVERQIKVNDSSDHHFAYKHDKTLPYSYSNDTDHNHSLGRKRYKYH